MSGRRRGGPPRARAPDFVPTEDDRERAPPLGACDVEDRPLAAQGLFVEKPEPTQGLGETRPGELPLAREVEEVRAQLGFRQLIGRGAEMSGEARDDRHVGLDSPLGVAAEMEVVDQALAQGGHRILSGKGKRGSEQRLGV